MYIIWLFKASISSQIHQGELYFVLGEYFVFSFDFVSWFVVSLSLLYTAYFPHKINIDVLLFCKFFLISCIQQIYLPLSLATAFVHTYEHSHKFFFVISKSVFLSQKDHKFSKDLSLLNLSFSTTFLKSVSSFLHFFSSLYIFLQPLCRDVTWETTSQRKTCGAPMQTPI